jgi:two-component system chemotaxis response regulator CheY
MEQKKRRVVIVDDSELVTSQLSTFFKETMGYEIAAIGCDGNQAVTLFKAHKPDLITIDITMPNKDGYNATTDIINEFPDANILIISALQGDTILKCIAAGAKGYIQKPIKLKSEEKLKDLISTIESITN